MSTTVIEANIFTGEDCAITINLVDVDFADLNDIFVGVITNKVLRKTMKKTADPGPNKIIAHPDVLETKKCVALIFRDETTLWEKGPLVLEVTLVYDDALFPDGKHVPYKQYICEFEPLETKDVTSS